MSISQKELNKVRAATAIIENGDMAVIEKLIEFIDLIEDMSESRTLEVKDMEEMTAQFEKIKSDCEDYMANMGERVYGDVKSKCEDSMNDIAESTVKDTVESSIKDIRQEITTLLSKTESKLSEIDKVYKGQIDSLDKRFTNEITAVKASIPTPQDMTAYNAELKRIKASIPKIPAIPPSDKPEQLRDKLETLKDDERLDKSAIRGLDEELQSIKSVKGTTGGGMFGLKQMRMVEFSFSGNDSTTVFYLPKEPGAKGKAIWAYYQGQHLQLGTHFTVANKTFTCVGFTPQTGSVIEGFIII